MTMYREYKIEEMEHPLRLGQAISYCHDSYNGPGDRRCGFEDTFEEIVRTIHELEEIDMDPQTESDVALLLSYEFSKEKLEKKIDKLAKSIATKLAANPA